MSGFEERGFLADDHLGVAAEHERLYGKYMDILGELNSHAQGLQYSLIIAKHSPPQLLSAMLFSRLLSSYQGAILLSQKGMKPQSLMLLRAVIEALFPLKAASIDPDFPERYITADQTSVLNGINKLIDYKRRHRQKGAELKRLKESKAEVQEDIGDRQITKLTTEDCAKAARMHDWYQLYYPQISLHLHSSPRSLHDHLVLNKKTLEIEGFANEADLSDLAIHLSILGRCLLVAISAIYDIFELEHPPYLDEFGERLSGLDSE
jgi:hypothetical protein